MLLSPNRQESLLVPQQFIGPNELCGCSLEITLVRFLINTGCMKRSPRHSTVLPRPLLPFYASETIAAVFARLRSQHPTSHRCYFFYSSKYADAFGLSAYAETGEFYP